MIPEEFKNLEFNYDSGGGGYYFVTCGSNPHMLWVGESYAERCPHAYDTEGFLIYEYLPDILSQYPELVYLKDNPEYRQYIKNFVIKSLL